MKYLVIIISILILIACQEEETKPTTPVEEQEVVEEVFFTRRVDDNWTKDTLISNSKNLYFSVDSKNIYHPDSTNPFSGRDLYRFINLSNTFSEYENAILPENLEEIFTYDSIEYYGINVEEEIIYELKIKTNLRTKSTTFTNNELFRLDSIKNYEYNTFKNISAINSKLKNRFFNKWALELFDE